VEVLAPPKNGQATIAAPSFAPAPGQSADFYGADGECLGGGEIVSWSPVAA
jgi:hypothetical protein